MSTRKVLTMHGDLAVQELHGLIGVTNNPGQAVSTSTEIGHFELNVSSIGASGSFEKKCNKLSRGVLEATVLDHFGHEVKRNVVTTVNHRPRIVQVENEIKYKVQNQLPEAKIVNLTVANGTTAPNGDNDDSRGFNTLLSWNLDVDCYSTGTLVVEFSGKFNGEKLSFDMAFDDLTVSNILTTIISGNGHGKITIPFNLDVVTVGPALTAENFYTACSNAFQNCLNQYNMDTLNFDIAACNSAAFAALEPAYDAANLAGTASCSAISGAVADWWCQMDTTNGPPAGTYTTCLNGLHNNPSNAVLDAHAFLGMCMACIDAYIADIAANGIDTGAYAACNAAAEATAASAPTSHVQGASCTSTVTSPSGSWTCGCTNAGCTPPNPDCANP